MYSHRVIPSAGWPPSPASLSCWSALSAWFCTGDWGLERHMCQRCQTAFITDSLCKANVAINLGTQLIRPFVPQKLPSPRKTCPSSSLPKGSMLYLRLLKERLIVDSCPICTVPELTSLWSCLSCCSFCSISLMRLIRSTLSDLTFIADSHWTAVITTETYSWMYRQSGGFSSKGSDAETRFDRTSLLNCYQSINVCISSFSLFWLSMLVISPFLPSSAVLFGAVCNYLHFHCQKLWMVTE